MDLRARFLSLPGRAASPGRACGPLVRNGPDRSADDVADGILVAERAVPDDVPRILAAAGTLTLGGPILSHVGLLSREFGRPSVALRPENRVRLLATGSGDLMALGAVAGLARPAVREGDLAMIDGDHGFLWLPGGGDPEATARIRDLWPVVLGYRDDPSPAGRDALVEAVVSGGEAARNFLLEAAIAFGVIEAGPPTRTLLDALADAAPDLAVEDATQGVLARLARETARDVERLGRTVAETGGQDDLERLVIRARALGERWSAVRRNLDDGVDGLAAAFAALDASVRARREDLLHDLRLEIADAARRPDETLRKRIGGAQRLVRRARASGVTETEVDRLAHRVERIVTEERERRGSRLIVPLLPGDEDVDRGEVGGKAAGLTRGATHLPAGCRVPRGFVVTTAAYRLHLLGEAEERLRDALASGDDEAAVARSARAAILSADVPDPVADAVRGALVALQGARLAVRSSATVEDGSDGSLAGQFDSWLGVRGEDEVLDRLRWCWASLWNARAIRTLALTGRSPLDAAQAVLIQETVDTVAAGVLASRDPGGRDDAMLVNAAWGLGEGISQGSAHGDLYWIRRRDGVAIDVEIGDADSAVALALHGSGTVDVAVPDDRRGRRCLDDGVLGRLATLARALEAVERTAVDVEFGVEANGGLVVFQVRRLACAR